VTKEIGAVDERTVGVRELKSRLSSYLHQVKAGHTVLVTEHGQSIARIVPLAHTLEGRLEAMMQAGLVTWNGKTLEPLSPVARGRRRSDSSLPRPMSWVPP
jgi:prevent-host-death family protein